MHPGIKMFRTQPVADGPVGPDRTRRPVGTDEMYAVHDEVRPTAGGPVGRFPDPGPLKYRKMSSPDDSYQPLVMGPLGTNEMNVINDLGRPTAGGPLGRPFSLDPMGPRAMLSLGDGNQPLSVGPVGRPWKPEQPGDQVTEPDYKQTTQTRSESESDTGALDSVIQTESEVQTDRVNISMVNGPTDSSVTPPSSDSGVHSLGEQWENMSTNSMNTGSIQTVKTFYGGDTSQVDRNNPQENRKVVFFGGTVCGKNDSMAYSTTDGHNSDIAAMSDFSDDEDGPQGELQPKILTECVSDDSVKEESNGDDRPVPDMTTAGVGANSLDPNDKEYWTKFRLLTRQAFFVRQ